MVQLPMCLFGYNLFYSFSFLPVTGDVCANVKLSAPCLLLLQEEECSKSQLFCFGTLGANARLSNLYLTDFGEVQNQHKGKEPAGLEEEVIGAIGSSRKTRKRGRKTNRIRNTTMQIKFISEHRYCYCPII